MPNIIGTLFHKDIPYGGVKGDKGDTGATPNISATASVNSSTGTPSVNVVKTGTAENPSFEFEFENLKGEKGDPGSGSSVDWGDIGGTLSDQTDLSTELAKKYDENDTAETDIADDDYVPFYDTSATGKRKSLWSNIKAKLKAYFDGIYTLLTIVGTVESGTTASKAYAIGEHFIKDGYFCTATTVIASGATLTLNTNYTAESIADVCKALLTAINQLSGSLATVATTGSYSDLTDEPINRTASNGSTTVSLCTRGEKYTWNNKANLNSATFSGTTGSSDGAIKVSSSSRVIVCVKCNQADLNAYGFIYSDGATYIKVYKDSSGELWGGKSVSGTYYYMS